MPWLEYFNQNGKLVKAGWESMDETNLPAYVEKHGNDRAAGYLEAMADFIKQISERPEFATDYKKMQMINAKLEKGMAFLSRPEVKAIFDMDKTPSSIPKPE